MFVERIAYVDYDGNRREEDFRFNLTQAELMELEFDTAGGLEETVKRMIDGLDSKSIGRLFKMIILKAYGEKSADGKRFVKSEELSKAFSETEAYNILYMKLLTNEEFAKKFMSNLVPNVDPKTQNVPAPAIVR